MSHSIPSRFPVLPGYDLNYPAQLIRFGVKALDDFEAMPNCAIDMRQWYGKSKTAKGKQVCYACLGGAAMVALAGITEDHPTFWENEANVDRHMIIAAATNMWTSRIAAMEMALDNARKGLIPEMVSNMGIYTRDLTPDLWRVKITDYAKDPAQFKRDLLETADKLEKVGY